MIDKNKLIDALYEACEKDSFKELPSWVINVINKQPEVGKWIPVDEALPKESGYYLGQSEDGDFGNVYFDADVGDCGEFGEWCGEIDPQTLGFIDDEWVEYSGIIAWQPLPEKYEG